MPGMPNFTNSVADFGADFSSTHDLGGANLTPKAGTLVVTDTSTHPITNDASTLLITDTSTHPLLHGGHLF